MQQGDEIPSRPFKGFDWSTHKNVSALIEELFQEYSSWYKGQGEKKRLYKPDSVRQHLTHFVLEAFRTYAIHPSLTMGVHLSNGYYNQPPIKRYHPNHLSYRIVIHVTEFLEENEYLEMVQKGEWNPRGSLRRTTRFRAKDKLIDLCIEHKINRFMIEEYPKAPEIIVLKEKKKGGKPGKPIDYKDTPFTLQARKNLYTINQFISKHFLNLDITDQQYFDLQEQLGRRGEEAKENFVDFTNTTMRRIFNNASFEDGGRFYGGWWQQIPSKYRAAITIDGKLTMQYDFSGMHFSILYAEKGHDIPMTDPYMLVGYDPSLRGAIKKAFNIIINTSSKRQAVAAIDKRIENGEFDQGLGNGEQLLAAFKETHPLITDKIASGAGIKGQFIDSQIAEKILLKGIDIDLCILPIHDGFITTRSAEPILYQFMEEAFEEITGHKAKIKGEPFDLEIIGATKSNSHTHIVTRPDGTVESDKELKGEAIGFVQHLEKEDIWQRVERAEKSKKLRDKRKKEWIDAGRKYDYID